MELCIKCKKRARIEGKWLEIEPDEYFVKLVRTEPVILNVCPYCYSHERSEAITREIVIENLRKRQIIEGEEFALLE